MPRRWILSAADKENLLSLPDSEEEQLRYYALSESDISVVRQHRGQANQLGFAIQLCYMRYPGIILGIDTQPSVHLLKLVASQLNILPEIWSYYGKRAETRREHLIELQSIFGFQPFTAKHYSSSVSNLDELALKTDKWRKPY